MRNITISLVRLKSLIENDVNMDGATSRIIAYASIETDEGIVINGISVRQDTQNKEIMKVVFPGKKVHNEIQSFVSFNSKLVEKEMSMSILIHVRNAIEKEINKNKELREIK